MTSTIMTQENPKTIIDVSRKKELKKAAAQTAEAESIQDGAIESDAAANDPLRRALGSEIENLEKKMAFIVKLASEKSIAEAIERAILENESLANDPDLRKIYRTRSKKKEIALCQKELEQKIENLTKIDKRIWSKLVANEPGYDPAQELNLAYENGEISVADRTRIIEKKEIEAMPEKTPVEDLAGETPDLYGFMEKTIQEQAQTRADQRAKNRQQAVPADETELAARAKMRRMARMRQEGSSEEEIVAFETAEAKFEPTPEMIAVSKEINGIREIAEQQLRAIQALGQLDETTLHALKNLNFTIRHLESLRANLRKIEAIARQEFEDTKEAAKKLLGSTNIYSVEKKPWLYIKGTLPKVTFGSKLRDALKKIIPTKEKKTPVANALKRFNNKVEQAYAEGSISNEAFKTKKQLADSLAKSANPSEDLDNAFAEGTLENILTDEEYLSLRKTL